MNQRERLEGTMQAYFDGVNGERYADVAALFAPGATVTAPGAGTRSGAADIEAYFAAALEPYPEHRDEPTRFIYAESTVTVEIHYTGKLATGEGLEFDAVDVFDLDEDGHITRLTSWYDSHAVRTQLRRIRDGQGAQ